MDIKDRIQTNSASLQKNFPKIYREFFSKCPVVVSAPTSFAWVGQYAKGGFSIRHKLPKRVYVGLEPTSDKKIKINKQKIFIPYSQVFQDYEIYETKELVSFIKREFPNIIAKNGLIIHSLSEAQPRHGHGTGSAFSGALALALALYYNLISTTEIENWPNFPSQELIDNSQLKFNLIFRLAWKIRLVMSKFLGKGGGCITSLLPSKSPIITFRETIPTEKLSDIYKFGTAYTIADSLILRAYSIERFFNLDVPFSWPIDWGLIFSGEERIIVDAVKSSHLIADLLEETANFVKKSFSHSMSQLSDEKMPFFYKICLTEGGEGLYGRYQEILTIISLEILKAFKDLFKYGYSAKMENFFFGLNQYHEALRLMGVSSPLLDSICATLRKEAEKRNTLLAAKLIGTGRSGDILFTTPSYSLREAMPEIIEKLKKETKRNIWLDYASWIDGHEEEGVKIEQFIDKGIYSKFISKGNVLLKMLDEKGNLVSLVLTKDQFKKEKEKIDLLFDDIEKKILIRGTPLSSKEIHSAKMTIEILKILMKNIAKEIPSFRLPDSSYIDRNEMQSKIVSPLKRVIKKRLDKKLNLEISGSLASDFSLKLLPSDLRICILEKIF